MTKKTLSDEIYKKVYATLPVGVLLLDKDWMVCEWNEWLVFNTGLSKKKALAHTLGELFPSINTERFHFAVDQVIAHKHPQVLSQVLNRYLIPIPLPEETWLEHIEYMQQSVYLYPIESGDTVYAMVVIIDVTQSYHQRHLLLHIAERFEKQSVHDELTGLYNRRFLWEYLEAELPKASREQYNVVCTVYDIDHFKSVNDELGHSAGDEVLLSFVDVLKKTLRTGDKVFRYGGEEFITISPHVKTGEESALATRVCQNMRAKKQHGSIQRDVTCSAGYEVAIPRFSSLMSAEVLVTHADKALYLAKETGRDKVCSYAEVKALSDIKDDDETHVVDFSYVTQLAPSDKTLQAKFFNIFLEEVDGYEERLQHHFEKKDFQALVSVMHPLKSSAKTIGAMALASRAEALEVAARDADEKKLKALEIDFMKLFKQTIYVIKTYLKS